MAFRKQREINFEAAESHKNTIKIMDLIVPIFALIIFVILTIYVYLPQITDAMKYSEQISTLKQEKRKLDSNLKIVRILEEDQNQLILDNRVAKMVVPAKLAVSDFAFDINRLALDRGLNLQSISSSDINAGESDEFMYITGVGKGITGPLKYDGTFEDVVEFLELIKVKSPYLIDSSETKVNRYLDIDDRWSLNISITGYYMVDAADVSVNPLGNISLYTTMPELMQEMRDRSETIKSAEASK